MGEIEHFFYCPYCGENISMLIDCNYTNQLYTEDCEVCCRPIEIDFTAVMVRSNHGKHLVVIKNLL